MPVYHQDVFFAPSRPFPETAAWSYRELEGRKISGRGVDTNVIAASAMAFLQVINRVVMRSLHPRLKPTDHVPQEVVPML